MLLGVVWLASLLFGVNGLNVGIYMDQFCQNEIHKVLAIDFHDCIRINTSSSLQVFQKTLLVYHVENCKGHSHVMPFKLEACNKFNLVSFVKATSSVNALLLLPGPPTARPTAAATPVPTAGQTPAPTAKATEKPTVKPTRLPTPIPTTQPTSILFQFSCTNMVEDIVIPSSGVDTITVQAQGAMGGGGTSLGGCGDVLIKTFAVLPEQKYYAFVGCESGFNGGGYASNVSYSGGGATDLRTQEFNLSSRILVAGGGGGYGGDLGEIGGIGGGDGGGQGGGGGATSGAGGLGGGLNCGNNGSFGQGGNGSTSGGGGGGGGYFGGGGGCQSGAAGGGGGGGSSYGGASLGNLCSEGHMTISFSYSGQSCLPTSEPTTQPSARPTQPTNEPTSQPTWQPSCQPTNEPSSKPTTQPSSQPSNRPSCQPTFKPSSTPTNQPSSEPTCSPTGLPSGEPTGQPTNEPSSEPTNQPSNKPSNKPSGQPTRQPSSYPTNQPSCAPTSDPTIQPISLPSGQPTNKPTCKPSNQPNPNPTSIPSSNPTTEPSSQPSNQPSSKPTSQPCRPSSEPSTMPSNQPSTTPTSEPTISPTSNPTSYPTYNSSVIWERRWSSMAPDMGSLNHTFTNIGNVSHLYVTVDLATSFSEGYVDVTFGAGDSPIRCKPPQSYTPCTTFSCSVLVNYDVSMYLVSEQGGSLVVSAIGSSTLAGAYCTTPSSYVFLVNITISDSSQPTMFPTPIPSKQSDGYGSNLFLQSQGAPFYAIGLSVVGFAVLAIILVRLREADYSIVKMMLFEECFTMGLLGSAATTEVFYLYFLFTYGKKLYVQCACIVIAAHFIQLSSTVFQVMRLFGLGIGVNSCAELVNHKHLIENSFVYSIVIVVGLFDARAIRYLPWYSSEFSNAALGYPELTTMKSCLFSKLTQSTVSLVVQSLVLYELNSTSDSNFNLAAQVFVYLYISATATIFFTNSMSIALQLRMVAAQNLKTIPNVELSETFRPTDMELANYLNGSSSTDYQSFNDESEGATESRSLPTRATIRGSKMSIIETIQVELKGLKFSHAKDHNIILTLQGQVEELQALLPNRSKL